MTDVCTLRRGFLSQASWARHLETDAGFLRLLALEMRRRFLLGLGETMCVRSFDRGGAVVTLGDDGDVVTLIGGGRCITWRIGDDGPHPVEVRP
jgi:hypothetical protein